MTSAESETEPYGEKKNKVVFIRHGDSLWNSQNKFTGWHDVPLSEQGVKEAIEAGIILKENGYTHFDVCHTSLL